MDRQRNPKEGFWCAIAILLGIILVAFGISFFIMVSIDANRARLFRQAQELVENGQYEEAQTILKGLEGYSGRDELMLESQYLDACSYYEAEDYKTAYRRFLQLGEYKDSHELLEICDKEQKYIAGLEAIAEGNYATGFKYFKSIRTYKDADDRLDAAVNQLGERYRKRGKYSSFINNSDYFVDTPSYYRHCEKYADELMDKHNAPATRSALEYYKRASAMRDIEDKIAYCEMVLDYWTAVENIFEGDIYKGLVLLEEIREYEPAAKAIDGVTRNRNLIGVYQGTSYKIHSTLGKVYDSSLYASQEKRVVQLEFDAEGNEVFYVDGKRATKEGNVLNYKVYGNDSDRSTFDLSSGVLVTQYLRKNGAELGDKYVYTMKRVQNYDAAYKRAVEEQYQIQKKKEEAAKNAKQTTTKKSSKNTTSMPDCDDYESFDDFMDDWDGKMPDGSNAEDYWDNW